MDSQVSDEEDEGRGIFTPTQERRTKPVSRSDDEEGGTRAWMHLRNGKKKGNNIIELDGDEEGEQYARHTTKESLVGDEYGESERENDSEDEETRNARLDKEIAELSPARQRFIERVLNQGFHNECLEISDDDEPGSPEEFARNYASFHGDNVAELSFGGIR